MRSITGATLFRVPKVHEHNLRDELMELEFEST